MPKLIGCRGGKCFQVSVAGLTGKVGADDETEAIRLFRDHHRIVDNAQRASVEAAEFDPEEPEAEKLDEKEVKPKRGRGKGADKETPKEDPKPEGGENSQAEASASDAASTSGEDSAKSQETDSEAK